MNKIKFFQLKYIYTYIRMILRAIGNVNLRKWRNICTYKKHKNANNEFKSL